MSWRPTATRAALETRAQLYALIRGFFDERNVLEVETPILSAHGNTDPNIESFRTPFAGPVTANPGERYLRTSPEFPLKRLLAAGIGDCYELGRVFRNGEAGRRHNPEFTMLEWYRSGFDHHALMVEAAELVQRALAASARPLAGVRKLTYRELFREFAEVDPFDATPSELHDRVADFGICTDGLSRDDWLDLVLTHRVEAALDAETLYLVHDFPPSQAALARIRYDTPAVAERFEILYGRIELANGYHELADPTEQRERFVVDNLRRADRRLPPVAMDTRLIDALAHGLPDCAGVALGVDRLLMVMLGTGDIADVLAFPSAIA